MSINREQFEADLEKLIIKYRLSAVLVLAHHECDLEMYVGGTQKAKAGMKVVYNHLDKLLEEVRDEVREAMDKYKG